VAHWRNANRSIILRGDVAAYIVRRTVGALIVILILIGVVLLMVQQVNLAPLRH
jgi:hypothetical protein